jgi:peptide/nickel transport system permease protein
VSDMAPAALAVDATIAEGAPPAAGRGRMRRLWSSSTGLVGLAVVTVLIIISICAALGLTPYPPLQQNPADRFAPPSTAHWMGTDQFGRDVASRLMEGILASMRISVVAVAISATIGSAAGIAAGFFGSWTDRAVGLLTNVMFAFPAILLALAVVTALGRGWFNTVIAIAVVYTPIFVRVARGPVLSVRELDFVKAGRVLGFGRARLLLRHVLPNVTAPIVVQVALALSWAILTESALSFLGLGTQPPDPSLGLMVSEARTLVSRGWWLMAAPASAIVLAVIGLNLLGDGLRDAFDPTRSQRR